jgi:hypothetical protein
VGSQRLGDQAGAGAVLEHAGTGVDRDGGADGVGHRGRPRHLRRVVPRRRLLVEERRPAGVVVVVVVLMPRIVRHDPAR